jgi:hypothetical protein
MLLRRLPLHDNTSESFTGRIGFLDSLGDRRLQSLLRDRTALIARFFLAPGQNTPHQEIWNLTEPFISCEPIGRENSMNRFHVSATEGSTKAKENTIFPARNRMIGCCDDLTARMLSLRLSETTFPGSRGTAITPIQSDRTRQPRYAARSGASITPGRGCVGPLIAFDRSSRALAPWGR